MTHFSLNGLSLGVATSSVQIEGGDRNNNWYDWAQLPDTIVDGSSPVRATDHWHRWQADTELMGELGVQVYRMSVEWSRIEPQPGVFDDTALQRYRQELTAIRAAGITPLVTLHHFSHPSWFQQLGEFTSPRSAAIFARFVKVVVTALGDLVDEWVTINEPNVYATQAYLFGEGPPGERSWRKIRAVLRNLARSHCRAYDLIHQLQPNARVGFAHHMRVFAPRNPRNPWHRILSSLSRYLFQDALADAMLRGSFSPLLGKARDVTPGRYYDFLGLNYYSRTAISKLEDGTFLGAPVNDLGWEIYPSGLVDCARWLHERYGAPVWITENGTPDATDTFRSRFIYEHLREIAQSSVPIERYYHWCFVDNWEWNLGEQPRFGLVHNDYQTQQRTVRASGHFYSEIIAQGGVTKQMYQKYVATQHYPTAISQP